MSTKEKTYFEILQEQAQKAQERAQERGPELGVGPQRFTIIGGISGTHNNRDWSAVQVRHTNGHEYRLFYNLYWPLKPGEITPQLNVDVFNWIVAFAPDALATYTEPNFDAYFNSLVGKQFEVNYTVVSKGASAGKVVLSFKDKPILLDVEEEEIAVDEINFDAIE